MAIAWIVIAILLAAVELHHMAFFAIFGTAGAAAAAGVAFFAPHAIVVQILAAIAVATLGVILLRPFASRAFAHGGRGVFVGGVHGGLISARGMTLDEVGTDEPGHVRILGEKWLAVTADQSRIPPATPVIVTDVTRTTLTVKTAEEIGNAT